MLHVIADFEAELSAYLFDGVTRADVRRLHHPAAAKGSWQRAMRWLDSSLPRRLDWYYQADLIAQLDAIEASDSVLLFSMLNARNLTVLQKYLGQAKVKVFLWNPLREQGSNHRKALRRLQAARQLSKHLSTFDAHDAAHHQLHLVAQPFRYLDARTLALAEAPAEVDLCFIGMDKGRLAFLQKFKLAAESAGLSCFFHILPDKGRHYSAAERAQLSSGYLTYAENLAHAARARCLLEVLQEGQAGATLRSVEALFLNRKLATTRHAARQDIGFDPSRVLVMDASAPPSAREIEIFMQETPGAPDAAALHAHEINQWLEHFM